MSGPGSGNESRHFLSLRSKIITGISALILILVAALLMVQSTSQLRQLKEDAETRKDDAMMIVVNRLPSLLADDDKRPLQNFMEDLVRTSVVRFIAVYDSSITYVYTTSAGFETPLLGRDAFRVAVDSLRVTEVEIQDSEGNPVTTRMIPLFNFNQFVGVALIGYKEDLLRESERQRTLNIVLLGVAALIAGVGLATLFTRNVVGPVERLRDAAVRIGSGEFGETVDIETSDEIGALAETFNSMSIELKKREEEVRRSERLSAIGTTASVIAHEMKTPLTSIKTYMDMLSIKYEDPDFRVKFTGTVDEQITRLGKLIDDLLDYSRDTRLHPADLDLNLQLHQAVSFFRDMFVSHRVHAYEDYRSEQIVKADPDKLEQVFFNLIKNGIEAQGDGGAIAAMTADDNGSVLAMIADAGGGVPGEAARNIFDPFVTTKPKGTGLGLAIARKIIVAHGGDIELYSPLGEVAEQHLEQARAIMGDYWPGTEQGSCFVVRLPAVT